MMYQMTLFEPPDIFTKRVKELTSPELKREQAQLLLQVELAASLWLSVMYSQHCG
ncbi:hypothetical protein [Nostoc sp. MS1]|uniref:hypothetical protein n=1 Tax=Nostoc sp. MS1 TaxID=2764711 RepID=UPI001CC3FFC5|nr:hypothetical protein [Nostoc sp. MS1]